VPEVSLAWAPSVWAPFVAVVVSQEKEYGAEVSGPFRATPSRRN
jgi:hypothetical protein